MMQSTITHYFKKEVQPTVQSSTIPHYFKKEIDIDWDEADNVYGEAFHNVQTECTARVKNEKLSEAELQEYVVIKNSALVNTRPAFSGKCPRCGKKNFKHVGSLRAHKAHCERERNLQCAHCPYKTKHKVNLIVHLSKVHRDGKNIDQNKHDDDGKFTKFCQKCNKISEALCPTKCEKCFSKLLYQCKKCSKQFKTRSLASYHWSTRCGVKGYFSCNKCDFKSVWRSKVVQHMKKMHKSSDSVQDLENIEWISLNQDNANVEFNTYKCPKCAKIMRNFDKLTRHIRSCGGVKREQNSETECENNIYDHHGLESDPIKCSNCEQQFDHIYSLNRHIPYCKKQYVIKIMNESGVKVVETQEGGSSNPLISADDRSTRYTEMLVLYCYRCHEDSSMEEKNRGIGSKVPCRKCKTTLLFKCKKCLKEYARYPSLKLHLDTICNPKEEFKCTKCSYKSYISVKVKEHYDSVHGTANAECKKCGRKFKSSNYLNRHLRRCGVQPKFQCEHCSFKSKLKIYLRKHIFRSHMEPVVIDRREVVKMSRQRFSRALIHLEAQCSKCKKEQRLTDRLKTCSKCKAKLIYKCKYCKKKYDVDDENACDHVKAYLETIKFECKRCGRGMISEKGLWMHEYRCGSEKTYKCRFCKFASKIKGNTTKHEKARHPHTF